MKRADVIKHFGNITSACEALGFSRFAIWRWKKSIPFRSQLVIEQMTGGALVASKPKSKKVV